MYTDFFVDTENLNADVLKGMKTLDKSDKVYLFYSKNSQKIGYDVYKEIINLKCYVEFIESKITAPNALDFELIAFVGIKIGSYKKTNNKHKYVILSMDRGYDSSITYMKEEGIDISRRLCFNEIQDDIILTTDMAQHYGLNDMYYNLIKDAIKKSANLQALHINLAKHINPVIRNHYLEIYKNIKPDFKKLKQQVS